MTDTDWTRHQHWHLLFNDLCNRAGHYDDASLASAYCALTGTTGQRQFDATVRSLNNWRSGRHVPQPRHAEALVRLLDIDGDPELHARWTILYRQAKAVDTAAPPRRQEQALPPTPPMAAARRLAWPARHQILGGIALFLAGVLAGMAFTTPGWRPWGGMADHTPIIRFEPLVTMKVGESRPIYAYRGDCGRLPPAWEHIEAELPSPSLGSLSDGGLARRNSKFCQGLTPAQAIVFSASTAGVEEFKIQGDFFKMTVEPES